METTSEREVYERVGAAYLRGYKAGNNAKNRTDKLEKAKNAAWKRGYTAGFKAARHPTDASSNIAQLTEGSKD